MNEINAVADRYWRFADGCLRPVELAAAVFAAAVVVVAMLLNSFDALLRYSINQPLSFNLFVTENYLMVSMIFLPMAWGFRTGGFIRLTFLLHLLPKAGASMILRLGLFASAVYCLDLAWTAGMNWHELYAANARDLGIIDWPWHWSWIWVPIGMGLLTLRLGLTAIGPDDNLYVAHDDEEEEGL